MELLVRVVVPRARYSKAIVSALAVAIDADAIVCGERLLGATV